MVIIFYDAEKDQLYICAEHKKMEIISVHTDDLMSYIPNDDILYVENGRFITKLQFEQWLKGEANFADEHEPNQPNQPIGQSQDSIPYTSSQYAQSQFIHPMHHGAISIADITTPEYPDGVELIGKYDFVSIDELGGPDALEESTHYKTLLAKGKIEVVDYDYMKKHYGKKKYVSAADAELDRITIKSDKRGSAEAVAADGGLPEDVRAVEILVEGEIG
jgi:hypothetical protein